VTTYQWHDVDGPSRIGSSYDDSGIGIIEREVLEIASKILQLSTAEKDVAANISISFIYAQPPA
jgi:hypothetical protein